MVRIFKTTGILFFTFFMVSISGLTQDIIIKNDKSELKSKVLEITDVSVKYKKWDNQQGPTYNIGKNEVFMIVYENGQRETFPVTSAIPAATSASSSKQTSQAQMEKPDSLLYSKNTKVSYKPYRIYAGIQSPLSLGFGGEFRIVKNIFNIGGDVVYFFPKDEYTLESGTAFIYGSLYAPINRLTGNYQKQNRGLFLFGQAGYGYSYVNTLLGSASAHGFMWRMGMDYFFTDGFGVTLLTTEFNTYFAGIVFSF